MAKQAGILFTAFEPSGDALAAAVIAELKRRRPDVPIYALGGPKMQRSGAVLIESSTDHAVMLAGAAAQAMEHRRRLKRLRAWLREHPIAALVPTDSPAANWSICKLVRDEQPEAKVVHLVAPQLWAWASWRIAKLRRLTDRVLCILPFEPDWLRARGVEATFVGHPLFEEPTETYVIEDAALVAAGEPKLALLPGSRTSEVKANWPTMFEAFMRLRTRHPGLVACVAASDAARAELLRSMLPGPELPTGLTVLTGNASAVLHWADVGLIVSGTATLHAAAYRTPMVVMYNGHRLLWETMGRWLIRTRTFSLPNLMMQWLDGSRPVPEFVPHFGEVGPVEAALEPLMVEGEARQWQREAFEAIAQCFQSQRFAEAAATALLEVVEERVKP